MYNYDYWIDEDYGKSWRSKVEALMWYRSELKKAIAEVERLRAVLECQLGRS